MDTTLEALHLESFKGAYAKCQKGCNAFVHDIELLADLNPSLVYVQHLITDVERSVTLQENVRSRRNGAPVTDPTGMHRQPAASSEKLDKIRFNVAAIGRLYQETKDVSTRVDIVEVPAPQGAQEMEEIRRRGEEEFHCTSLIL